MRDCGPVALRGGGREGKGEGGERLAWKGFVCRREREGRKEEGVGSLRVEHEECGREDELFRAQLEREREGREGREGKAQADQGEGRKLIFLSSTSPLSSFFFLPPVRPLYLSVRPLFWRFYSTTPSDSLEAEAPTQKRSQRSSDSSLLPPFPPKPRPTPTQKGRGQERELTCTP